MAETHGPYPIGVAARMLKMHPQTLRKYERAGFLAPSRTAGLLRLYSQEDIERLRLIKHLVDERGLNLSGVDTVLSTIALLSSVRETLSAAHTNKTAWESLRERVTALLADLGA